ncbi:hypothetical protein AXG93_1774s1400 [Marchantia polymorpha subsp. ruderalis]|uniref:Uncharacterized protein n=1 Tax=Marchantia polymorpha subsp. ruderalis TaxID=1480154 RepID=A0A176W1U0_MARPO|nr:hypothetical protein AXG93_1774s1400 [Marchantia polymorpha subsp. ruderalis]
MYREDNAGIFLSSSTIGDMLHDGGGRIMVSEVTWLLAQFERTGDDELLRRLPASGPPATRHEDESEFRVRVGIPVKEKEFRRTRRWTKESIGRVNLAMGNQTAAIKQSSKKDYGGGGEQARDGSGTRSKSKTVKELP